jgi:ligand-binding sensor domain-containing protein
MKIIGFAVLVLFFLSPLFHAQENFEFLTINQGLSQNYIYSIYQDKKGFIWIGTKDGLNRYDGYEFVCYRHNPADSTSLSENNVSIIFEDSKERLWIGTNGGGLNLFNREKESFTHFVSGVSNKTLSRKFITGICESRDGFLWIGTTDGGLNKFDPVTYSAQRFIHNSSDPNSISSNYIHGISESNDGLLWIGTAQGGLNCFNPESNKFSHILPNDKNTNEKKYMNDVTAVFADGKELIWFGTASGLNLFNKKTKTIQRFPLKDSRGKPCFVSNIIEKDNSLYISSFRMIAVFDKKKKNYSIINEQSDKWFSNAVCKDKSGIFWIGTGGWGVMKYNPKTKMFNSKPGVFLTETFPEATDALKKYLGETAIILLNGKGTEFLPIRKTQRGEYLVATPRTGLYKIDASGKLIERLNTNPSNVSSSPVWPVSDVFEIIMKILDYNSWWYQSLLPGF